MLCQGLLAVAGEKSERGCAYFDTPSLFLQFRNGSPFIIDREKCRMLISSARIRTGAPISWRTRPYISEQSVKNRFLSNNCTNPKRAFYQENFLHSWPTLYEASPDDISHKHASAYSPASHQAHDVGNALSIPVGIVGIVGDLLFLWKKNS